MSTKGFLLGFSSRPRPIKTFTKPEFLGSSDEGLRTGHVGHVGDVAGLLMLTSGGSLRIPSPQDKLINYTRTITKKHVLKIMNNA